jgi:hypothetical protein
MHDTHVLLTVLAVLGLSCGSPSLTAVGGALHVPPSVEFEPTFVGFSSDATVELRNDSRASRSVVVRVEAPFEVEAQSLQLGAGSTDMLVVRFRPTAEGLHDGSLRVTFDAQELVVALHGRSLPVPSCESSDCIDRHFEPGRGCVDVDKPEGTRCGAGDRCLVNPVCRKGECLGSAPSCDDGNACTSDACASETGCVHAPVECQPTTDPCQASVCDPVMGCRAVPVVDGTRCGPNDCQTASICMAGACVQRASPDGSVCAPATSCRPERRCVAGTCGATAPNTPPVAWSYSPPRGSTIVTHALAGDGALVLLETGTSPALVLKVFEPSGARRFEADLTAPGASYHRGQAVMVDDASARVVVALHAGNVQNPQGARAIVQALDLRTGARRWTHEVSADVPHSTGAVKSVEVGQLMLLDGGAVGVRVMEGDAIHQTHVLSLDGATGALGFRVQRPGHAQAGVTASGLLFVVHAACWSQDSFLTVFDASGAERSSVNRAAWLTGFAMDSAVVWTGTQFELDGPSGPPVPLPLPANHLFVRGSVGWSPTETRYVTRSAQGFHLTQAQGSTVQWSAVVTQDLSKNVSMQRLDLGRTAAFVHGPTAQELVIVSDTGGELDRCWFPGNTALQVVAGVTVARSTQGFTVFSTPGLDMARTGWVGAAGGPQGTNRPR